MSWPLVRRCEYQTDAVRVLLVGVGEVIAASHVTNVTITLRLCWGPASRHVNMRLDSLREQYNLVISVGFQARIKPRCSKFLPTLPKPLRNWSVRHASNSCGNLIAHNSTNGDQSFNNRHWYHASEDTRCASTGDIGNPRSTTCCTLLDRRILTIVQSRHVTVTGLGSWSWRGVAFG